MATGVHADIFLEGEAVKKVELHLQEGEPFSYRLFPEAPLHPLHAWLDCYVKRLPQPSLPPLALHGLPPFTERVLRALEGVPFGSTLSYGELAVRVDSPRGARAVGQAVHRNPLPLLLPCHRIICSDGSLGGFACGLDLKKRLLHHEQ